MYSLILSYQVFIIFDDIRSFHSVLRHSKGVFGASVEIMVGGVTSTEYDHRTFYEGKLHGE